jgi:hypothetical protein
MEPNMPESSPETLREVGIRLGHLERAISEQGGLAARSFSHIDSKLDELEKTNKLDYIHKDTYKAEMAIVDARIKPIERLIFWGQAFVLSAIGTAFFALVLR